MGELLDQVDIAHPAETYFASAHQAGAISEAQAQSLARDFQAYVKGRAFWPAMLLGAPITQEEAEATARSAAALFSARMA